MAPDGHAPPDQQFVDRHAQSSSIPRWHERHGSAEFKVWKKDNPTKPLSYDDWKSSEHVDGLSLYYTALHIWEESDSNGEEFERVEAETLPRGMRGKATREPKRLSTNGNGFPRAAELATPSTTVNLGGPSASGKKKRKPRKKFQSAEFVASDGDSEIVEAPTPATETGTPSAPIITVNGRRKSSSRKPKKKLISDESISPLDEENDTLAIENMPTPTIASPLPVRSAPSVPATARNAQSPQKTILRLNARKAPKKKVLSDEMVLSDDTDEGNMTVTAVPPTVTTVTEANFTAAPNPNTSVESNTRIDINDATASPEAESASAAAIRRGLRARRPAQQRPYSYDARIFEEHETDVPEEYDAVPRPPDVPSGRASVIALSKGYGEEKLDELDKETLAILQGEVEPEFERADGRPKHFKGKGRAWKKEESDEDLEFNPGRKKAAKAKAKGAKGQQPKKRGRPRKSNLSEDVVRDDSDDDEAMKADDGSMIKTPSPPAPEASRKVRRTSRRSGLSEEMARDNTEEDGEKEEVPASEVSTPAAKKRGRPRKSDPSTASKTAASRNEDEHSYTPKGTPRKSCTPRGEPRQPRASVQDAPLRSESIIETSEFDSDHDSHSAPADIEEYMAGVNMDSDEEL